MDLILSNTNAGKKILKKLTINENKKNEEFNIKEKKLKNEENKIELEKNIHMEEMAHQHLKH